ncbi:hypothetical protein EPUS_01018 [Endocarpon pusillum Z07020]|uniref:Uncharacterized protein n=1 Tax=Endocarpon pusillum (strain Z07020 / HMAS-L-300199) TaxID=1263415 RepID=U1FW39_ENDPU|nr:uncharacterized protein EPUS_01018 [Endocarpon pusillum Z07020]ERF69062.1 hypothetical protein EPUS_01018 [Endocarpon pusillum Z07020]
MSAPQDTWGNIKIPRIGALGGILKDSSRCIQVLNTNVDYSSLVAIPVTGVAQTGNSSFTMDSAYYDLTGEDPIEVLPDDEVDWQCQRGLSPCVGSIRLPNSSAPFDSTFSMGTFAPNKNRFADLAAGSGDVVSDDHNCPRTINIQSVTGSIYS